MKEKIGKIIPRLEVLLAIVLFFVMLVNCGMYIDVKMNGKSSSLQPLPEKEKAMLLMPDEESNVVYKDDLLEPAFIGVKSDSVMIASVPGYASRRAFERTIYDSVFSLFSGKSERLTFTNDIERRNFVNSLAKSSQYMLVYFGTDIPSSVFVPCLSNNYGAKSTDNAFFVNHLFLLRDENDYLYGIAVSKDMELTKLTAQNLYFNSILSHSYDIEDGYSSFEYAPDGITPVLSGSFDASLYKVNTLAKIYGKEQDAEWVKNTLEMFGVNMSLVKSFSSGDKTEINYVYELCEVLFEDDGTVRFTSTDSVGLNLRDFLGFYPADGENYSFNDKIFAVKNIVNKLYYGEGNASYTIVGIDYSDDTLRIYLKCMIDGIFITDENSDAVFEIKGNALTYAEYMAVNCVADEGVSNVIPQKYASLLVDDNYLVIPVLVDTDETQDIKRVEWASYSSEVKI